MVPTLTRFNVYSPALKALCSKSLICQSWLWAACLNKAGTGITSVAGMWNWNVKERLSLSTQMCARHVTTYCKCSQISSMHALNVRSMHVCMHPYTCMKTVTRFYHIRFMSFCFSPVSRVFDWQMLLEGICLPRATAQWSGEPSKSTWWW